MNEWLVVAGYLDPHLVTDLSYDTIAQYCYVLKHAGKIDERACTVPLGHCSRTMHRVIEPSPGMQGAVRCAVVAVMPCACKHSIIIIIISSCLYIIIISLRFSHNYHYYQHYSMTMSFSLCPEYDILCSQITKLRGSMPVSMAQKWGIVQGAVLI